MEFEGARGMMLMESKPESTRKYKENHLTFQEGGIITDPHWMYYKLMWFPGLTLLNCGGLAHGRIAGRAVEMCAGDLFDIFFGGPIWRQTYVAIREGYFLESFRRLLSEKLGAYSWLELTAGLLRYANARRGGALCPEYLWSMVGAVVVSKSR